MKKGSKLYSILKNRCPRCAEMPFFECDNPYKVGKMFVMNNNCAHCNLNFQHEPGFYLGAMYVSYILAVFLALVIGLNMYFIWKATFTEILLIIPVFLILTSPVNFRLSRLIWINIWIQDDPAMRKK